MIKCMYSKDLVCVCRNKIGPYLCTTIYKNNNVNFSCSLCFPNSCHYLYAYSRNFLQLKVIVLFVDKFQYDVYNYSKETIASTCLRRQLCIEVFVYNFRPREECLKGV